MLSMEQINDQLRIRGAVCDIGQISTSDRRALDRSAKRGGLVKYRGFWNTLSPLHGIGPLKSCWRMPDTEV